jgi:hypothetical protein
LGRDSGGFDESPAAVELVRSVDVDGEWVGGWGGLSILNR